MTQAKLKVTVGVLALQGAFSEHIQLLRKAVAHLQLHQRDDSDWQLIEVRTPLDLQRCNALIIPGGESTTISLVAERSGLLEPLREFVKSQRKPTWGTCAGLILLAESANQIKKGGQELIGGLDVRVNRNHFGRQVESFQVDLQLPFLSPEQGDPTATPKPFRTVFIRAPVVEEVLQKESEIQNGEGISAPATSTREDNSAPTGKRSAGGVEILARLPNASKYRSKEAAAVMSHVDDIIAVRQGNVFGTSFHPELTGDARIHVWWLEEVLRNLDTKNVVVA